MLEQHEQACQLYEAEKVFDAIFPSSDQWASILHLPFSIRSVGRDHLDAVLFGQLLVQRIGVVSLVANQPFRQLVEEATGQNSFHKPALCKRSAFDRYGKRQTVTRGDSDDLGAFATLEVLRRDQDDQQQIHNEAAERLTQQLNLVEKRLEAMFADEYAGRIPVEIFDRLSAEWGEEQARLQRCIKNHRAAMPRSFVTEGAQLLELAANARNLFEKQPAREKRRLLQFAISNSTWKDGGLTVKYRQPFDLFATWGEALGK